MENLRNSKNGTVREIAPYEEAQRAKADSRALQEIIDILKYPFQTCCDTCVGLGYTKNGKDCPTCKGSGRIMDGSCKK